MAQISTANSLGRKTTSKKRKRHRKRRKEPSIVIVGRTRIRNPKTKKLDVCKYSDVPVDINDWVTDLKYLPIYFDMVEVRIKDKVKTVPAWFDGAVWQGLRLRQGNVITAWKRNPYEQY